jgi:hypothetical protein
METTFRVKEILSGVDEFHAVVEAEPIGRQARPDLTRASP